ncbi:MAG TPA: ATP-binding protein [Methanocorpusculum sp.]|nr:ATP-binding protein [Methanocorpusculum sp.]
MKLTAFLKKYKIVIAVSLTVALLFAAVTGSYIAGINNFVYSTTETSLEEIAIQEEGLIDRYLESNLETLEMISVYFTDAKRIPETIADAQEILNRQVAAQSTFSSICLVDEDGKMYTSSYLIKSEPELYRVYLKNASQGPFHTRLDHQEGSWVETRMLEYIYCVPFKTEIDGIRITGIIGKSQLSDLEGKLDIANFNNEGHTSLVDSDGMYLINENRLMYSMSDRVNLYELLATDVTNLNRPVYEIYQKIRDRETFTIEYTLNGVDKISLLYPMDTNGWYLIVTIPEELFLSKVHTFTLTSLAVLAGIGILFILFAVFMARYAAKAAEARTDAKNKSGFLASMSHEIRTPLNGIIGLGHMMESHITEPEKLKDYLAKLESTSHYLLNLINDILDVSKLQSGKAEITVEPCALELVCDAAYSMNASRILEKKIAFSVSRTLLHQVVLTDTTRLQQVINNIISNAYKFTPEGGKITMEVTQEEGENNTVTTYMKISDTGCGMSPEFIDKIFEEFTQDRNANRESMKGTGLGMPISRQTMQLLGGDLLVSSELGVGSTFTIVLPALIASDDEIKAAVRPAEYFAPEDHPLKILVAEDNELNAEILCEVLDEEGISNDLAENGEEALNMFKASQPGEYDIILMDMQMPVLDGLEAAKAIRALPRSDAKTVRIFACTANTFAEDREAARAAGMDDFIPKPIDVKMLTAKIHYRKEKSQETK